MLGSAAIVAGGSLLGGAMESKSAEEINEANIAFARRNTLYQTHMSNTAYQRAVEDMKAAGINPMMAATKGGASTPGGMTPKLENPKKGVMQTFANAAKGLAIEVPMAESTVDVNKATVENKAAQDKVLAEEARNRKEQNALIRAQADVQRASAQSIRAELPGKQVRGTLWEAAQPTASHVKDVAAKGRSKWSEANAETLKHQPNIDAQLAARGRWFGPVPISAGAAESVGVAAPYGGKHSAGSLKSHK